MKFFEYFFYRVYEMKHKKNRDEVDCFMYAILSLDLVIFMNLITFNGIMQRAGILPNLFGSKITVAITMLVILSFIAFYFYRNKRYKLLEEKYQSESERHQTIGGICVVGYIALSFILVILRV